MSDRLAGLAHPLFACTTVDEAFADQRAKALAAVDALRSDDLLTGDLPGIRRRLVDTYRIDPLRLDWDACTALPSDDGATVRVFVPFSGAAGLLDIRPSRDDGEHPTGWVRERELVLVLPADGDEAHPEFERQKALVTTWVARLNTDVEPRNERLTRTIRTRLAFEVDRARRTASLALDFGPPPLPRRGRPSAERHRSQATSSGRSEVAIEPRGPGRPPGSRDLILDRYEEAFLATLEPRTYTAIAENFRTMDGRRKGITPRHLRRLLRTIEKPAE